MMELKNKLNSISFQFLLLLLGALLIASISFLIGNITVSYFIDMYIYTEEYETRRNEKYLHSLQEYIDRNDISMQECQLIGKWVKKQQILSISVYQDNRKIYDSDYPNHDFWLEEIEEDEYEWVTYYKIWFTDGAARIGMSGRYEYQLYQYAMILEIIGSFVLFVGIILAGIRRKIEYIKILSKEIGILENGSLEYEITIRGRDELTVLANGLDRMRLSFQGMMERESQLIEENQKTITEMSHDLRTPVTSILLFLEVMKKDDYQDSFLVQEYAKKLEQKALHMKQLTDHLFKYTLVSRQDRVETKIMSFADSFFDPLSEMCAYLERNGFSINMQMEWVTELIRINMEYQARVLDNIASNIMKYADNRYPIQVSSMLYGKMVGLTIRNNTKNLEEKEESYGVGLKSIENMMQKIGGECRHNTDDVGIFNVVLLFEIIRQD